MRNAAMRACWIAALLVPLAVQSASAKVFEVWTEMSLGFAQPGSARATATSTGLATLDTSSSASSRLSTVVLPGLSLDTTVPITDPVTPQQTAAFFSVYQRPDLQGGGVFGNVASAISGSGALAPNTLPHTGWANICLLVQPAPPCVGQLNFPVGATQSGARIGLGVGGLWTLGSGDLVVTLVGAPYTVGTASAPLRTEQGGLSFATERGFAHGPLSLTSSVAQTGGVLQIVTAESFYTVGVPSNSDVGGLISHTLVHVIPEPGLFLPLASGAALLALLGWRRRR